MNKKALRKQVMRQQGIILKPGNPNPIKKMPIAPKSYFKTPSMRLAEAKLGMPIEEILQMGSLSQIVKLLDGEIDKSTVSRWIKRLKLRYSATNLPSCYNCQHRTDKCDIGLCAILWDREEWELVLIKRKEVMSDNG